MHVATQLSSGWKPAAGLLEGLEGRGSCQDCGGDRSGSRRGRLGGSTPNFLPQPQLLLPPRISSETAPAELPSARGAILPLVVGSKETALPVLIFFSGSSWGVFFFGAVAVPLLSCALSRVGDRVWGVGGR